MRGLLGEVRKLGVWRSWGFSMGSKGMVMVGSMMVMVFMLMALDAVHADRIRPTQPDIVSSLQDPKYKIDYHPAESPVLPTLDQETIMMTDRDGKKFRCNLPIPEVTKTIDKESQQNGSSTGLLADDRSTRKTPEDLLDALKDKCLFRYEGWWIYELCYKGHLRQFHLHDKKAPISTYGPDMQHGSVVYFFTLVKQPSSIPYDTRNHRKTIVQEFYLGTYDPEATAARHENSPNVSLQKDPRSQSAAQRYHAHVYTNGTVCDLTNQPRETEVRFVCSETGRALINSIKEAPTCKYTVVFHAPTLCKHPAFQEERQPWVVIDCNAIPIDVVPVVGESTSDGSNVDTDQQSETGSHQARVITLPPSARIVNEEAELSPPKDTEQSQDPTAISKSVEESSKNSEISEVKGEDSTTLHEGQKGTESKAASEGGQQSEEPLLPADSVEKAQAS